MTATRQPRDQTPSTHADDPGDIPAEQCTSLDRLDALTGQWEMEATFEAGYFGPASPDITGRGNLTTFEWSTADVDRPAGTGRRDWWCGHQVSVRAGAL